ncbi:SDR family oxidoreductase [Polynucleobacter sp. Latsch14-2]|jgi:NAD(P)-dependent dehydrogenase (short-subunit alcohol dehydrogenase family)|uniref:SDR family NAD(P)-dependent oxidoreductase n=1 Tax=Polynucleobacter sp. Latsch14-2 TaxID=2576920 RepID=UPI001C0AE0A4|nr:SDR family oxidoreductase [Polynucleobacter sp. Latsch14-2]MBU3614312.1 SDR family oxidoreductase [Polynucleobacter sp. Latsch14-2]
MSNFQSVDDLNGKVAVIIGGNGAVGFATAQRLAKLGATCVLIGRNALEKGKEQLNLLPGSKHLCLNANITDSASLVAAASEVNSRLGRCDILVNSAGFTKPVPAANLDDLTDELIDDVLKSNFRGVLASIRAFQSLLKANSDGLVVNVSSISAFTGVGSNLAYVAAKASLDIVSESLAKALAPNIRVLCVSPGVVDSAFVPGRGGDFNEKTAATTPLKRIGIPDDVASAIEACATRLRFSTGTRIVIDGGRHL